ncbi:hypothetical protein RJG79_10620 [Mycoplasmatota bacterium WC44]
MIKKHYNKPEIEGNITVSIKNINIVDRFDPYTNKVKEELEVTFITESAGEIVQNETSSLHERSNVTKLIRAARLADRIDEDGFDESLLIDKEIIADIYRFNDRGGNQRVLLKNYKVKS